MSWFAIAIFGYTAQAFVFLLDKLILSKSLGKPIVYTFYSTIYFFAALLALPFGGTLLTTGFDWLMAVVSGLGFGFGLWTMFIAVKEGEATHINPFIGAIITVATFGLSSAFLAETLTSLQIAGMALLVFASLLLSFEKSKKHSGFHVGFLWAIISGLFFAVSHVSAKYLYDIYPFITGFIWTRATTGLVGIVCLFFPAVRRIFRKKKTKKKSFAKRHALSLVVIDKVFALVSVVAIQYAIAIGSVTLVNAMSGLQFALLFIFMLFTTRLFPKVLKEYFTKKELIVQTIAIILVVFGSALFVF